MDERISALLDGELDEASAAAVLDELRASPAARHDWQVACLLRDVLREDHARAQSVHDVVMARLEREPTVLAPSSNAATAGAANDSSWRRAMSIAAAVMGIAVVGWTAMRFQEPTVPLGVIAKAHVATPAAKVAATSERESNRAYLLAHQAYAGGAASPGVTNYVRTAADLNSDPAQ